MCPPSPSPRTINKSTSVRQKLSCIVNNPRVIWFPRPTSTSAAVKSPAGKFSGTHLTRGQMQWKACDAGEAESNNSGHVITDWWRRVTRTWKAAINNNMFGLLYYKLIKLFPRYHPSHFSQFNSLSSFPLGFFLYFPPFVGLFHFSRDLFPPVTAVTVSFHLRPISFFGAFKTSFNIPGSIIVVNATSVISMYFYWNLCVLSPFTILYPFVSPASFWVFRCLFMWVLNILFPSFKVVLHL